ncbi:unnamed protein product [Cuscuta epithymum]|uniref:Uncharacterized protein n=1 Tax=Cuscuta epithymum TaxID=186058 RepID=A0AAV0DQR5_9ASTE|nr:unnamed protein product [Cuscuta epithymum]
MLLAIEGGGLFSSSASGYSSCISLLLLGQNSEEKPIKVTPWTQYQLANHGKTDTHLALASKKNRKLLPGCAPFICFGRASSGLDSSPSCLKVGSTQHQEVSPTGPGPISEKCEDIHAVEETNTSTKLVLKSSLKRVPNGIDVQVGSDSDCKTLSEGSNDIPDDNTQRRKVHWTDTHGGELFEIREFETSDEESDDDCDSRNGKTCSCKIM